MCESLCDVLRPTTAQDAAGGTFRPSFRTVATQVPCSVSQSAAGGTNDLWAQPNASISCTVSFPVDPQVQRDDHLAVSELRTGNKYNVIVTGDKSQPTGRGRFWEVTGVIIRPPTADGPGYE